LKNIFEKDSSKMARADVRNNKANGIVRSDVSVVFVLQSESFKMPNFENFLSDIQMFSHFDYFKA